MFIATAKKFFGRSPEAISGVAAIEFAFVGVLLAGVVVPVIDLGTGIYRKVQVQNSAQAGAQYAVLKGFSAQSISTAVTSTTRYAGVSANPAPTQFCGCPTSAGISNVSCNSTCSGGMTAGTYVTVSAKSTYVPLFAYPSLPSQFTLAAKSTVRIQ